MDAGCHAVKFQLRDMLSLYRSKTLEFKDSDLGVEYTVDLLNKFQLPLEAHKDLYAYCKQIGIQYLCTPWDIPSVDFLESEFDLPAYKVASADFTNISLIERLIETDKPLIMSTGMSTLAEIEQVLHILNHGKAKYVLLHCNSTYPLKDEDANLRCIETLRKRYNCNIIAFINYFCFINTSCKKFFVYIPNCTVQPSMFKKNYRIRIINRRN